MEKGGSSTRPGSYVPENYKQQRGQKYKYFWVSLHIYNWIFKSHICKAFVHIKNITNYLIQMKPYKVHNCMGLNLHNIGIRPWTESLPSNPVSGP